MAKSGFAKEALQQFVKRIMDLETQKKGLADDIKEVYSEAKGAGFDTKIIRTRIIKLMKMERADIQETDAMEGLYRSASDLPPFGG